MVGIGLLTGGAIVAFLISCWGYIKGYLEKVRGLCITTIEVKGDLESYIKFYCDNNFVISKTCIRCFNGVETFIRPMQRRGFVIFKDFSTNSHMIYWKGWKPIVLRSKASEGNNGGYMVSISFIRWLWDVDVLMKDIERWVNEKRHNTFCDRNFSVRKFIGRGNRMQAGVEKGIDPHAPQAIDISYAAKTMGHFLSWNREDIGEPEPVHPMSLIALSAEAEAAVQEIRRWKNSEQWYKERSIPWKRGIALTGKPGNGKSTLARLLAIELNMRLNVFDISTMDNKEFQDYWKESLQYAPAINLIEDIDAVFDGRKNIINPESGLSFDCLLNTIDGVETSDGILTIITTNHIEKLDPAIGNIQKGSISSRPGRIDRMIEMVPPDEKGRRLIASRILRDTPEHIEQVVTEGHGDSGAQFQERCSRLALQLFWSCKKGE